MRKSREAFLVLMLGGFFHVYGMECDTTLPSRATKYVAIPWSIRNFLRDPLYICMQEKNSRHSIPASITKSSDPDNETVKEGTITLDTYDVAAYEIKKVVFPIKGRLWTDKNKKGIEIEVDNFEDLTTNYKEKYPLWRIEQAELSRGESQR